MQIKKYFDKFIEKIENCEDNKFKIYVLFCLSLIVRLIFIDRDVFIDEAFSYFFSKMPIGFILTGNDTHPPIYYLFLKPFALLFGNNIILLRLTSIFIWILLFIATYFVIKQIFNKKIALYTLFFMSFSPTLIYYSTELRMYILALFFSVLNLYFFYEWLEDRLSKYFIITTILMIYTHILTVLIVIVELFYAFYKRKHNSIGVTIFIFLLSLPQILITFFVYTKKLNAFNFQNTSFLSLVNAYGGMVILPSPNIILYSLFFVVFFAFFVFYKVNFPNKSKLLFLFLLIPFLFWLPSNYLHIWHTRFFVLQSIPLFTLFGIIIFQIKQKTKEFYLIPLMLYAIAFIFTTMNFKTPLLNDYDLQSSLTFAIEKNVPIVHQYPYTYLPAEFYFENKNITNLIQPNWTEKELFTWGGSVIDKKDLMLPNQTYAYFGNAIYWDFKGQYPVALIK